MAREDTSDSDFCDKCGVQMDYCFYVEDEDWLKANNDRVEGYLCAHCCLDNLSNLQAVPGADSIGMSDWYFVCVSNSTIDHIARVRSDLIKRLKYRVDPKKQNKNDDTT
jgi:hypothetical protein